MSASEVVFVVVGALVYLAIGSFVCVVIDRLPLKLDEEDRFGELWDTRPWGEVFGGTSRCSSCGTAVRPYQNIPVISWVSLRGRCSSCGERIPAFHPWVEALTPLLFLGAVWAIGVNWWLLPVLWLIPVGVAVSVIDLRTMIVPTRIVWPAFAVSVALTVLSAGALGSWSLLLSAVIGVAVLAGPLFVLWFAMPASMGFGDVRLTVLLGWNLGFYAGTRPMAPVVLALVCLTLSSLIGLVLGVGAMGLRGRKAKVPFGPALVAGTFLCIALAQQILDPFEIYSLA